jgi:outer membrane biosynthesis protein TonB
MKASYLIRSILAGAVAAALMSTTVSSTAAELKPLVVIGVPLDSVAIKHPVPTYPRNAQLLSIDGVVNLIVQVDRGQIVDITVKSGAPLLADYSVRWVRNSWRFNPSVSGQYLLPIAYKLSS